MNIRTVVSLALAGAFCVSGATLGAAEMTLTGTVGDAMCGVKHPIEDSVACTQACVKKGSDYALIVKDKAYTLKTSDDKAKAELAKLAGKMATIVGDVTGDTITVASVMMAK
jgi:hypothetical protein